MEKLFELPRPSPVLIERLYMLEEVRIAPRPQPSPLAVGGVKGNGVVLVISNYGECNPGVDHRPDYPHGLPDFWSTIKKVAQKEGSSILVFRLEELSPLPVSELFQEFREFRSVAVDIADYVVDHPDLV